MVPSGAASVVAAPGAGGCTSLGGVIDIGAGASVLVDTLLGRGFRDLTVLDIAPAALDRVKARLGARAKDVTFVVGDVTRTRFRRRYDLWHDRAAFHFLVEEADRVAYRKAVEGAVRPGGHVILATFAPDGPEQCSGLPVRRHDAAALAAALGPAFELLRGSRETHITPWNTEQRFQYALFRRTATG